MYSWIHESLEYEKCVCVKHVKCIWNDVSALYYVGNLCQGALYKDPHM